MSLANKTEEGLIKIKCTGTEELPLDKIKEFQGALKKRTKAQKEKLLESLKTYGFSFPFFIWKNEGINWCLDGHGRLEVLNSLLNKDQLPTFPVVYVQAEDEAEAKKKLLQLNSQYGEIDTEGLQEFIDGIDIDMSEFEIPDINLDGLIEPKEEGAIPEVEEGEPICKLGDIWQLGNHRLMCGDSTNGERVDLLMNGEKADMVFTDPPYGISYADKNKFLNKAGKGNHIQKEIKNDHLKESDLQEVIKRVFINIKNNIKERSSYYITAPQGGDLLMMMMMMMQEAGLTLRHMLIWVKNNHVLGRTDYNYKHEPILFGWINVHDFYGKGEHKFSTWEISRPNASKLHPTMKPVELIENALLNSSQEGNVIIDYFGGSGSTLIACEKLNRKCYMMELDEKYCDVIIKRWENYTGEKAVKING